MYYYSARMPAEYTRTTITNKKKIPFVNHFDTSLYAYGCGKSIIAIEMSLRKYGAVVFERELINLFRKERERERDDERERERQRKRQRENE